MVSTSKPNVVDEVAEEMGTELRTVRRAMVRRSGITNLLRELSSEVGAGSARYKHGARAGGGGSQASRGRGKGRGNG